MAADTVRELTRDEILEIIDSQARARRGTAAGQLLRSYRDGTLQAPGEVADLLALADLLPDDDPLFDGA